MTTQVHNESTAKAVLRAVENHTGYDASRLTPDAELEADLGIDSVILEGVLGDLESELTLTRGLDRSCSTIGHLLQDAQEAITAEPAPSTTGDAENADESYEQNANRATGTTASGSSEFETMRNFGTDDDPDLFGKARRFAEHRRAREEAHLYWYGMPSRGRLSGSGVFLDTLTGQERDYLMFASNNYLGLANDPRVAEAIGDAASTYGATNTGCRIIGGTTSLHLELERRLAVLKGRESCIVFPGGYSANLGTISALAGPSDTVIADKLNHMSIVDGSRLSGARRMTFQHNDMESLEQRLAAVSATGGGSLVVVDGVFSMHGDICPLPALRELTKAYGARLLVDDAHSTGVLGRTGSGTAEHFGVKGEIDLEVGTMSKALAGIGGFLVGDDEVVEYLRYYAHSYVFGATVPAPVVAGLVASIEILQNEPERIERLWGNIRRLRTALRADGFDLENTESAILPVVIGDDELALRVGREVRARGMFCQTVVFPGVPEGDARLRISVTAEHDHQQLDQAADIVREAAAAAGFDPSARPV